MADGFILVTLRVYPEDGQYVSECRELDVASCGSTTDEAYRSIQDAVRVHLAGLMELGERDRYLADRRIEVFSGKFGNEGKVELRAGMGELVSPFAVPIAAA